MSGILKFDLNAFINDDYYTLGRLEEKYKTDEMSSTPTMPLTIDTKDKELNRRWSLSVPASPRLSPKNMFESQTPRLTIDIPAEEKETYEEESPSFSPSPTNYVNSPHEVKLISAANDMLRYTIPSKDAYDARRIWKRARIPHYSNVRDIETRLISWAFKHAQIKVVDDTITKISWLTHSNCICTSTWSAFIKWMLCASSSDSNLVL
jgi:hypothetical protein